MSRRFKNMNRNNVIDLLSKLDTLNKELCSNDDVRAIITHWLFSPLSKIPFLSATIRNEFWSLINGLNINSYENYVKENIYYDIHQSIIPFYDIPFPPPKKPRFRFIDIFAGIGGFRIAMQKNSGKCVFSSEWDNDAKKTYENNYGEVPFGDIRKISETQIPDHDVLCAGFPCQPFSLAGVSARNSRKIAHGFLCETQGTLFFDIIRIAKEKKPKVLFLENVKNIVTHDGGKTFKTIRNAIYDLNYSFNFKLIDSSPLVPQRRVRCYMVCIRNDATPFVFPEIKGPPLPLRSILEDNISEEYTISDKLWDGHKRRTISNLQRGNGFTAFCADLDKPANTIVARYGKDGKECLIPQNERNPRMLSPRECARLQGFPDNFIISVSKTKAYKQFGNSIAVPVVTKIGSQIAKIIDKI